MGTQQLPLCWNSHQTEILATFQRLLVEESLVDVTLACEGIRLKAHKTILSACSPFFQDLFLENPCKHPIVIMKDIKYRDLKGIVDFMYHGGINVAPDQLSEFLKTAEALKVKGLSEHSNNSILELNRRVRSQEKTSQKVARFQESLSSCIEDDCFMQTPQIREDNEHCEQQSNTVNNFIAVSEKDATTIEGETNTFNVKSEPEPNDDTCEEVLPEHSVSDDSLLSVHYDERFVPEMEISEGDQNLMLVPRCQREIVTSETLPHSSNASTHDAVLPLEHISSEESLGVVISPDITNNPEPVMHHYAPFQFPSITVHSTSNEDIKPVALMSYEESAACSTSIPLCQGYNSADLRVKRIGGLSEQRAFISNEEVNPPEWVEASIEEINIEENPNDAFGHQSGMRGKLNVSYRGNTARGSHTVTRSKHAAKSGGLMSRNYTLGNLRDAVNAVKRGMPLRQAQQLFKVPRTTIHTRIKGKLPVTLARCGRYPLLGKEIEEELKLTLKGMNDCISEIPIEKCLELAYNIAEKAGKGHLFPQGPASRRWFAGFMKRHDLN